jgi:squalene-associated FAD-dependent desaturase
MTGRGMAVAVVGAGWAGLAAAVRAAEAGHHVTLFEMAAEPGGRARTVVRDGLALDNGQHILIGAYLRTLALMQTCGVDLSSVLHRMPLTLRYPDGRGLQMPAGPALPAFARAVMACVGWTGLDRLKLLGAASGWALRGFRCDPTLTVDALCRHLPPRVRELLIDPLCVAALNTPARDASAQVLLRVLRDALFSGRGSADLLLPRRPLGELLPAPARHWLTQAGADLRWHQRVQALAFEQGHWHLDGEVFDHVVLACSAAEAARLSAVSAPAWSARAAALHYEPIVTVYLRCDGARLAAPMMALVEGPRQPAQFAFDHGAMGGTPGLFALVVSGARPWVEQGLEVTAAAAQKQVSEWLPGARIQQVLAEKRATFRCTPGLDRPPAFIAPGLVAAGDYVKGPYPATLEGAVRAGEAAAGLIHNG